jgi:uncharacterized protein (DUF1697 family)
VTRYAVLLRGVNVGSRNKVPMPWLREAATGAGFSDVATYVQSGNLLLTSRDQPAVVSAKINALIKEGCGCDVDVIVRSRAQLKAVVAANPFPEHEDEPKLLHVVFLTAAPPAAKVKALDPEEFAPEQFTVRGSEIYTWHPNGFGRSKLASVNWAKRLGAKGTDRNWRTVTTLLEMLDG